MKKIPLTQGQFALVDDADFEWLNSFKWCANWKPKVKGFYAIRSDKRKTVFMHRQVLGLTDRNILADHINHRTLDNRRKNLRPVSYSQNMMNRHGARSGSKTGLRGVRKLAKSYVARIKVGGKDIHLGVFSTAKGASTAYAAANKKHFGRFGGAPV